ncbi:MAG: Fe-S protein assembly co-chaperone HscB [Phycisphaerae bacterium]|nr:Fe-S protein assembly co-chaperone HscB [Phycisphaerae bacterium]
MSQPANDGGVSDPFATFGIARSFSLDVAALRPRLVRLLAECHPDRAGTDPVRQAEASRRSAEINAAFRTLQSPLLRAEALLALAGSRPLPGDALAPAFLMEMMETREALDEAIAARDEARIAEVRSEADARRVDLLAALAARLDAPISTPAEAQAARQDLAALRYVERILERIADR